MQQRNYQKPVSPVVFTLRSVQPSDAQALDALIESLPYLERRWRFHGAVNGVSPQTLERLTCVDSARHVAYVVHAHAGCDSTLIADGRFARDEESDCAELALMVSPAWRSHGIGCLLLSALASAASHVGVRALHGGVMPENATMQRLLCRGGFKQVSPVHAEGAIRYELKLVPDLYIPRAYVGDRRVSRRVPGRISSPWTVRHSLCGLEV